MWITVYRTRNNQIKNYYSSTRHAAMWYARKAAERGLEVIGTYCQFELTA